MFQLTCKSTVITQCLVLDGRTSILVKFLAKKWSNANLKRSVCLLALVLYQSLYNLPNLTVCSLKLVLVLTNTLGCNLISVLGLTNPLGRRLISAFVLTCHLKCQEILLILLCLAVPFFNSPRLLFYSKLLVSVLLKLTVHV